MPARAAHHRVIAAAARARRAPCCAAALTACALLLAAGCGSSGGSSGASAGTSATAAQTGTETNRSTLRRLTTPRYISPSPTEPVRSGTVQVLYRNIAVHPPVLRVRAGSVVKWTNVDPIVHNVTSESGPQAFASGPLSQGASFQVTLTRPGIVHYRCTIHPATMNGTIEVVA